MKQTNVRIPEELRERIAEHQERNLLGNQQAAIVDLLCLGIKCENYRIALEAATEIIAARDREIKRLGNVLEIIREQGAEPGGVIPIGREVFLNPGRRSDPIEEGEG